MRSLSVLSCMMFGVALSQLGCSSPSEPEPGTESAAGAILGSKMPAMSSGVSTTIPFLQRTHFVRTEGTPNGEPWAKVAFPEPGVIEFDGTDGHSLLDVASSGVSFDDGDAMAKYMVENFNAKEVLAEDGRLSFALTIVTDGKVGYTDNITAESFDFVHVTNPVLAILGGKEGVIHFRDEKPVPVQSAYGAGCVNGVVNQGVLLPYSQCNALIQTFLPAPFLPSMFATSAVTSVAEPPSSTGPARVGACGDTSPPPWPGTGGYPNGGGIGRTTCIPQIDSGLPGTNVSAPYLSIMSTISPTKQSPYGYKKDFKQTYRRDISIIGQWEATGPLVGTCARHGIKGDRERFDTITFPAQFTAQAATICAEPWQ